MKFNNFVRHIQEYESNTFSASHEKITKEEAEKVAEKMLDNFINSDIDGVWISSLHENVRYEAEEKERLKKEIRAKVPFSDEQLKNVAESLSSNMVYFFIDDNQQDEEFEDDGSIHVRRMGVRFVKDGSESQIGGFARNIERKLCKLQEETNTH